MTRYRLSCALIIFFFHAAAAYGDTRLTAVGTSLTQRGNWTEILAQTIARCTEDAVAVERIAAAGRGSDWGVAQLDRIVAARPAIVLVEFAINDADVVDGVSIAASRRNHEEIIDRLRAANPKIKILLLTTNPVHGPRGWVRPFIARYYRLYHEIAQAKSVGLIDLYPVWRNALAGGDREHLIPDGLHPAEAAFARVALPVIRERLSRLLCETPVGCS